MLKAQMTGSAEPKGALPEGSTQDKADSKDNIVDAELDDLRRQLDNL